MPTKLTSADIAHVATLARISTTEEDRQKYAEQISVILEYIEMLNEVDTEMTPETCQVTGLEDVFREDTVVACPEEVREKLIAAFPERMGRLLKVKAVFDGE
ncbi:MAG: hypothetical protein A3J66_01075 [Candidatus Magasanikbacteria bacterium RIFCSPHIGHO2_02_FULL_47_14]|uniref:Aspartyl/glutamyl-tRNA(Asn/Gln) amidotransferase subunit C n=1 Tax=Candidatus Magasanikbacteria bacterium RIFCSPHIGHO2_02_FULL_47_14 TaxID=1798680 RepID=A0A1F6MAF3_9BACT|nr:MAG: hypothetical protein A3J66_01075 [Candidatus Magasanikbacteria bacterium RIFCSPHIGHO2_02_FULL_47_14]